MTKVQKNSIHTQKLIFLGMCLVLFSLVVLYMYLVGATVLHVVMRTELDQQSRIVRSDISELESQYILAQHKVSEGVASLQGYTRSAEKVFIDRTPSSLVLSSGGQ